MGMRLFALTFMPLLATFNGVFYCRNNGAGLVAAHPTEDYIRQLGTAAALSHFQLWGGMALVLTLWRLLIGPQPLPWPCLPECWRFPPHFRWQPLASSSGRPGIV